MPIFEAASDKHTDVVFGKVDTEAEEHLAAAARITSIPTVMAFHKGTLVYSQAGALPMKALDTLVGQIKDLEPTPHAN